VLGKLDKDVQITMIDGDSSDDAEQGHDDATVAKLGENIDLWNEFWNKRILAGPSKVEPSNDITARDLTRYNLDISNRSVDTLQDASTHKQPPMTEPVNLLNETAFIHSTVDAGTVVPLVASDYTLNNGIITIPELGVYKQKNNFPVLATIQMIENMLSQSTRPRCLANDSVSRSTWSLVIPSTLQNRRRKRY
jgi:hypothetical protein